jgi:hypothetical protein
VLDQLRQFGAPPAVLAAAKAQVERSAAQAVVLVWPEHWHAVLLFRAMATQWHWAPCGLAGAQRVGLRMEALPAVRPAVAATVPPHCRQPYHVLVHQLQQLEDAALAELRRMQA